MAYPTGPTVRKGNICFSRGGSCGAAQIDKLRVKFLTSKSKYERLVRSGQIEDFCSRFGSAGASHFTLRLPMKFAGQQ